MKLSTTYHQNSIFQEKGNNVDFFPNGLSLSHVPLEESAEDHSTANAFCPLQERKAVPLVIEPCS